ncbi:unnamed protein product [Urochloa humidicola]
MVTEQAAEDLVPMNPYSPDILNDLKKFVNEQHQDQRGAANGLSMTAQLFFKALMTMLAPDFPDFSLCLFLIPEHGIRSLLANASGVLHGNIYSSMHVVPDASTVLQKCLHSGVRT